MKIVIVETDVKVDKSFVASLRKLIQWYGQDNIILDTGDWKKCLKFMDMTTVMTLRKVRR